MLFMLPAATLATTRSAKRFCMIYQEFILIYLDVTWCTLISSWPIYVSFGVHSPEPPEQSLATHPPPDLPKDPQLVTQPRNCKMCASPQMGLETKCTSKCLKHSRVWVLTRQHLERCQTIWIWNGFIRAQTYCSRNVAAISLKLKADRFDFWT